MSENNFNIETFRTTVAELFDTDRNDLSDEYNLAILIKDSIDLGELVATLKSRYGVAPKSWEAFAANTTLQEVFSNFE